MLRRAGSSLCLSMRTPLSRGSHSRAGSILVRFFSFTTVAPSAVSPSASASASSPVFARHSSRPLKLALLGAPGVGKGTFASRLGPYFQLPCISTGDLIRAEIKTGSERGRALRAITDRGGLIDDTTVLDMLLARLSQPDCIAGFILDGYPRRITQAQALQRVASLDLVLNISLREDILITKATARRVCGVCGTGYNFANIQNGQYNMPPLLPKKKDTCDKCGTSPLPLIQRSDDTEATVRQRLVTYHKETAPLIEFYSRAGLLVNWEVSRGLDDWPAMREMMTQEVNHRLDTTPTTTTTNKNNNATATATASASAPSR